MGISLRGRKLGPLLLGWAGYWVGLLGVTLTPLVRATLHATTLPDDHSSVTAGFNNAVFTYTVIEDGVKTWASSTPISTALLWFVGPPLVWWVIWLAMRGRNDAGARSPSAASPAPSAL